VSERAAFPQSLVGFTPSEIAFTSAEFGPESGARLEPDGRPPPTFLESGLASRIDALTYLGYSERFYDVRSPKVIYISRRIHGLCGGVIFKRSDSGRWQTGRLPCQSELQVVKRS
jgi:hypothetical protein